MTKRLDQKPTLAQPRQNSRFVPPPFRSMMFVGCTRSERPLRPALCKCTGSSTSQSLQTANTAGCDTAENLG
jgi:hypothetical protein